MKTRVKIVTNIPTSEDLKALIEDYKASGALDVGWAQQPDGKYRLEAILPEEESSFGEPDVIRSPVTGSFLRRA